MLTAYTDGSTFLHNPGPMSWAVVYVNENLVIHEETGALYYGTNNQAELLAVIWALEHEYSVDLTIYTDSLLTKNIATKLWRAKKNLDLWHRFELAQQRRDGRGLITIFGHVRGHSTNVHNNRADELARLAGQTAAACLQETRF